MQSERYARVRTLFDAVIDEPADQRRALLDAIELDPAVIDEVLELIAQSERRNTEQLGAPLHAALANVVVDARPGDQFGVWRVEREIGQGGMGAVYLVQREDGHFRQTAALKFIKGSAHAGAVEYFSRERQVLASLAHPQIARLLDGGATAQGQPYLVMEYIDGVPIDVYCATHALGQRAVLELFASACTAVAFAHRQLVVHCDLKPSNLLVDKEGRPILLDFGIAQLVDRVGAERGALSEQVPAPAAVAYTPRYASPEQRNGERITTASDVYSLGIVLRELIVADHARGDLGAELSALIAKATDEDPTRRYVSVDALCGDIDALLSRRVLAAMPSTAVYRARKLVQRRWPLLLALAAFAITVAAFTTRVMVESQRAHAAEAAALVERDRALHAESAARASEQSAHEVTQFLTSVFDGASPDAGTGNISTNVLVAQALTRVEESLDSEPATQAQLYAALAGVQDAIEQPEAAIASYQRAIAIERGLQRPLVLARMLIDFARLQLKYGDAPEMLTLAREAYELVEQYGEADSPLMVDAMVAYAEMIGMKGDPKQSIALFQRAIDLVRRIEPGSRRLANTLSMAGWQLRSSGDLDGAIVLMREQESLFAQLDGERTRDYLSSLETLAGTLAIARRFEESETAFHRLITLRRASGNLDSRYGVWSLSEYGRMLTAAGRPLEAIMLLREAVAISLQKFDDDGPARGVLLNVLGTSADRAGDYVLAESSFREALGILDKVWNEDRATLALIRHKFGASLLRAGRVAEANVWLLRARDQYMRWQPPDNSDLLAARLSYADGLRQVGSIDQAGAELDAIELHLAALEPEDAARLAHQRALLQLGVASVDDSLHALQHSESLLLAALGPQDARSWLVCLDRVALLNTHGRHAEASALAADIFAKVQPRLVPGSTVLAHIRSLKSS